MNLLKKSGKLTTKRLEWTGRFVENLISENLSQL
jgi:hypothetical protein